MKKSELKEEIERLREELYRVADSKSPEEMLIVSQRLDQLILLWMELQKKSTTKIRLATYNKHDA